MHLLPPSRLKHDDESGVSHGAAAMPHEGRDPIDLHRKQAPDLAKVVQSKPTIGEGVGMKRAGGVPRVAAAEATIVWDRGLREGWDLTAAPMFRYEHSQPVGLIFELTHLSLYRFMSQRARVAPMHVESARRLRFEAP